MKPMPFSFQLHQCANYTLMVTGVTRPNRLFLETVRLRATRRELPVPLRRAMVRSLVGESLQIHAMSPAVLGRRGEGTGVGRSEAEGTPRALRPVSLMRVAALPVRLRVGCNAKPAPRKSIPLGRPASAMSWSAGV